MIRDSEKLIKKLNKIGIALSAERDVNGLLKIILEESMSITGADAASIYVKEEDDEGKESLRFAITQNMSRSFEWSEFCLKIDKNSIAGYVAYTKHIMNLADVYNAEKLYGIHYNSSFDEKINYKTVNMLTIPMLNYNDEVVGVLQLINKKKNKYSILMEPHEIPKEIIDFEPSEEEIIKSLAAQAGILIERTRLYDEIQELLSSFISAMVTTLDARDITTSGHSRRLAGYALHFIRTINSVDYGPYAEVSFSDEEVKEMYYAALLHDIGKVGVREWVLSKENKLNRQEMEVIKYRFKYFKTILKKRNDKLGEKLDEYYEFIYKLNSTGFLSNESKDMLDAIHERLVEDGGELIHLITEDEYENLSIKKGNLTDAERQMINDHVSKSYEILSDIKWTKQLKDVPSIAGSHHEKLDGSGYPKGLKGEEINTQSRILAILDIFEALTARDRPYKPPMSVEKAISILEYEIKDGHLDKDLFEIFMKEKIYELYKEELNKIISI